MGIIKEIKYYFQRKQYLKILNTENVVNASLIDQSKPCIVFISNSFPTHDKDSGSNRFKEIIFLYQKLGYRCVICVEKTFENHPYISFFKEKGIIIYVENKKYDTIFDFLQNLSISFFWYNGPLAFSKYFQKLKKISSAKHIYDMVDIHFLRYQRAIKLEPTRISLRKDYLKFKKIETKTAQNADIVIAISDKEKEIMSQFLTPEKIKVISNIHYPKIKIEERNNFEQSQNIIFIGSIHPPNIDAVNFLYHKIMPKVWDKLPDIKVLIIGNVSDKINIERYSKFNFLGYVKNVDEYFKTAKIMVAPLRFGAGVKGKIGQAFEYFLPIVTTSIGAEGMNLQHLENICIGNDEMELSENIIQLYTDKNLWDKLSKNSLQSLEPFSLKKIEKTITNII